MTCRRGRRGKDSSECTRRWRSTGGIHLLVSYKPLANPQRRTFGLFARSTADQALFRIFWSHISFTPCVHAINAAAQAVEPAPATR